MNLCNQSLFITASLALMVTACVVEGEEDEVEVDELEEEITSALPALTPNWAVRIQSAAGTCTATVLSEHYLLTSAHCVTGVTSSTIVSVNRAIGVTAPAFSETIYSGTVTVRIHADFDPAVGAWDPPDDIALVKLTSGGINLAQTGQAKIFRNTTSPFWADSTPDVFSIAGWGLTNSSGGNDCTFDAEVFRRGSGYTLNSAAATAKELSSSETTQKICNGDSGGPWMIVVPTASGDQFIQFAITSGTFWLFGTSNYATNIQPKFSWIESASRIGGIHLDCSASGSVGGFAFRTCVEEEDELINPPAFCPRGLVCCEVSETGSCLYCGYDC